MCRMARATWSCSGYGPSGAGRLKALISWGSTPFSTGITWKWAHHRRRSRKATLRRFLPQLLATRGRRSRRWRVGPVGGRVAAGRIDRFQGPTSRAPAESLAVQERRPPVRLTRASASRYSLLPPEFPGAVRIELTPSLLVFCAYIE